MKRRFLSFFIATFFLLALSGIVRAEIFTANLQSAQEVPPNASTATGYARIFVNPTTNAISWTIVFNGLTSNQIGAHVHAPAAIGANAGIAIDLGTIGGTSGTITGSGTITPTQLSQLRAGLGYVNVHSSSNDGGEIRGQLGKARSIDYDGDGRQDYSILRFPQAGNPLPITFWNKNSTTGDEGIFFGGNALTDFPAPGDYDGDAKTDLALYRAGTSVGAQSIFVVFRSSDSTFQTVAYGLAGDLSVARDYDADGRTDFAIYRGGASPTATAQWWIRLSSTNTDRVVPFGLTGDGENSFDSPVPADYDGDGMFDIAVYRFGQAPNNHFIILRSSDGAVQFTQWGNFNTDWVVPGDYDGDGKADLAVARFAFNTGSPMVWWILHANGTIRVAQFGLSSPIDFPVQGDYDGDARVDIAVYRPGTVAFFWVLRSFTNSALGTQWGTTGDFPVGRFDTR